MPRLSIPQVVGARELKTRLGAYLRAVQKGAVITVTERGVPVARLLPLPAGDNGVDADDALLDELAMDGIVTKASGEPLEDAEPLEASGEPIDRTIVREREDRV